MASLQEVEKKTANFSKVKAELDSIIQQINKEAESLKQEYLQQIKLLMSSVTNKHSVLFRTIMDNPDLFKKPRTYIFDGIEVGLKRGKGKLVVDDEDVTIKLIEKRLPDQADILIKTKKELSKATIMKLSEAEMGKINISVGGKEDQVVIKSVDTIIHKVLNTLLKFQVEDLSEEYKEVA